MKKFAMSDFIGLRIVCFMSAACFLPQRFRLSSMTTFCIRPLADKRNLMTSNIPNTSPTRQPALSLPRLNLRHCILSGVFTIFQSCNTQLQASFSTATPALPQQLFPHKQTVQKKRKKKPIPICPPNQMIPMSAAPSPTWPSPEQKSPTTLACRTSSPPSLDLTKSAPLRAPTTMQGLAPSPKQRITRGIYHEYVFSSRPSPPPLSAG